LKEAVSDISPYLIIIALSVALLVVAFIARFLFSRNRSQYKSEPGIQKINSQMPMSGCHEKAYKLLPEVVLILNSQYKITYLNLAAEKMLGCKLRSVMGKDYRDILTLKYLKTQRKLHDLSSLEALTMIDGVEEEYLLQVHNNKSFPVKLNLVPMSLHADSGLETYSIMVLKNISEIKALESKVSMLDSYDSLTGVLNRKSFDNEIKQLMESTHKHNSVHVLSYFSIDQFRDISDSIGHAGTENLNIKIIEIIKSNIRKDLDIIARVADSEFCVVFRENKLVSNVRMIEAILKNISDYQFKSAGQQYPVSMSAGLSFINNESTSSNRVISEANRACNTASKRGGGRLLPYRKDDKDMQRIKGNIEWILILKKAIQENQFEMYAQPIHALAPTEYDKPFSHYELLIRLNDEKGNPISTVEFITAAEYYNMMPALDRWVLRDAFRQISKVPKQTPLPVFAINLSGQSLNDPAFLEFILNEIKSSAVNPQMLCFEITEQVAVGDMTILNKLISTLKALGSAFSLDDFGTGASTYEYLRSLNVDYLKIDGSFVKNIANDEISRSMVESATQIGHTMNLKIIAEYVENVEIVNILNDMGIEYGQGYHIERPGPLSAVIKRHQNANKAINL
jgi:diguanylate cyclase (GGDEF)-like protein/PAS domain S-box-containing protein